MDIEKKIDNIFNIVMNVSEKAKIQ